MQARLFAEVCETLMETMPGFSKLRSRSVITTGASSALQSLLVSIEVIVHPRDRALRP
jgi:hypothetical protein